MKQLNTVRLQCRSRQKERCFSVLALPMCFLFGTIRLLKPSVVIVCAFCPSLCLNVNVKHCRELFFLLWKSTWSFMCVTSAWSVPMWLLPKTSQSMYFYAPFGMSRTLMSCIKIVLRGTVTLLAVIKARPIWEKTSQLQGCVHFSV